jgi:CDP-paratose 2-epimerase
MATSLITGGAGFIGSNLATRLLADGQRVVVLDNLSRTGAQVNVDWLQASGGERFRLVQGDVTDAELVRDLLLEVSPGAVYHEAGQVAVTTSVADPRQDFTDNALGTLNVLEAVRACPAPGPVLVFASTNKVYGGMEEAQVVLGGDGCWGFADLPHGVAEDWPLDFHSPYGCSKGAADQYVRDYARIYGLRTVVFRQSCIYGYRQFGVEDQGWVAWFTIATELGRPITIYGDGRQVRDVLFIDDLVDAYLAATRAIDRTAGQIFNIGGGPASVLSLLQLLELLGERHGMEVPRRTADWRPGDQRVFVSDIRRAREVFGWSPLVSPREGVTRLAAWVAENRDLLARLFPG